MMTSKTGVFGILFLNQLLVLLPAFSQTPVASEKPVQGFAVVELFTSQGCSSCPAADTFLAELGKRASDRGEPLFTLSFHVDYWDYLGWSDPYAQAEFTDRQRAYGKVLKLGRIFTPQMVVNGTHSLVGSDRSEGSRLIDQALSENASCTLSLSVAQNPTGATLHFQLSGTVPKGSELNLACVEPRVAKKVLRGENRGRELTHHHVVRTFETLKIDSNAAGTHTLTLPEGHSSQGLKLIGYVQKKNQGRILAATMISL